MTKLLVLYAQWLSVHISSHFVPLHLRSLNPRGFTTAPKEPTPTSASSAYRAGSRHSAGDDAPGTVTVYTPASYGDGDAMANTIANAKHKITNTKQQTNKTQNNDDHPTSKAGEARYLILRGIRIIGCYSRVHSPTMFSFMPTSCSGREPGREADDGGAHRRLASAGICTAACSHWHLAHTHTDTHTRAFLR